MNELGLGDHLPPVREHGRWVSGRRVSHDGRESYYNIRVVVRTHDAGAADRAAAWYAKTVLGVREPRVLVADVDPVTVHLRPIDRADRRCVTRRRVKGVQCKHLPDLMVLAAVHEITGDSGMWCNRFEVHRALGEAWPWRVVLAKLSRLINRGYMTGCACGCRGDFEMTGKGREALESGRDTV